MNQAVVSQQTGRDHEEPDLLNDIGTPEYNRRLTDKILAAFNHAYSVGEVEIASKLHAVLADAQSRLGPRGADRRGNRAVTQADLWMKFVQARDAYRGARQQPEADPATVARSLDEMKEAYRRWSVS